ncbi:MAG TPA: tRNA (adenosine(37)-N6)-threonylcarbamoyltransferase complex ATPase subunit type 1 TsaE [Bacteroidales bacterium]|nr:tRNA (adenosine(37)-N6)-threonylcarbamoyltransferase complex ATPase subunit type 1 TsaE [Bacteroidales bacterium]
MKIELNSLEELPLAAEKLIGGYEAERVFAFFGKMGAGKTTFIKQICTHLEVEDVVTSPTFALINEYLTTSGNPVFHFDFYRIEKSSEAVNIGFDEYIYSDEYCLIEWPEKVEAILPEKYVRVTITEKENGKRVIEALLQK